MTVTWVPSDACTLPTVEQPLRVAEFDELFASSVRAVVEHAPTRLSLTLAGRDDLLARVQDLADRESSCCSFFSFHVTSSAPGTVDLVIDVPQARVEVLAAIAQRARAAGGAA